MGENILDPWACIGDFNDISHHREKGGRKDQHKIDGFNRMMEDLYLEDIGFKGQMFTWTNNRRGGERIKERLDRVLANQAWCARFPSA